MKKILFILPSFGVGGVTSSLSGLLSCVDTQTIQADVFALYDNGPSRSILSNCNFLSNNIWWSVSIKNLPFCKKVILLLFRILCGIFPSFKHYMKMKGADLIDISSYDAVISYSEELTSFVSDLPAKKKIAWVHCIYSRYKSIRNNIDEMPLFSLFDKIVCVSDTARDDFVNVFPTLSNMTLTIYNVINEKVLREKAAEDVADRRFVTDCFTIVSVGRLDPVKQFSLIPNIAKSIQKKTYKKFRWYIIGGDRGLGEYDKIQVEIMTNSLSDVVIMLGEKNNPYPYLSKAQLFVHTSASETFGLVISEAKALGVPPMINNFSCACETVTDEVDGFIVPNDKMADRIARFIDNPVMLNPIINRLKQDQSFNKIPPSFVELFN